MTPKRQKKSSGKSSKNPVNQSPKNTMTPANHSATNAQSTRSVKPEEMSVTAHDHIQAYLKETNKSKMDKEDLNAVLRLSQHLRVFGLLSAVGYLNQSNAQGGKVRERTVPVWGCLLGQLLGKNIKGQTDQDRHNLMSAVVKMTKSESAQYMAMWRKSLLLAQQWNFWARAYSEGE
ncbi:hypothetical protein [Phormidium sp. CCY1219]|uniref:hypothetical protein n=1 Tax=Phormidium sp. CCY1219 TaxID=2886104 RepID=UPI002D1F2E09|nr:hypothetical protein [Phormidium sp. CCY1219]MEB3830330.1 hypothetical protein [Phormidium sp. CCY1219]